jgi:hypothetical protein
LPRFFTLLAGAIVVATLALVTLACLVIARRRPTHDPEVTNDG